MATAGIPAETGQRRKNVSNNVDIVIIAPLLKKFKRKSLTS